MRYILTSGWDDGIADLNQRLVHELAAGKRVLWLVSGGSNIPASVQVMNTISRPLSQNLTVMLADERYGAVGHADSNEAQIIQAGFRPKAARLLSVLQPGLSLAQTAAQYAAMAGRALAEADCSIGQFGIGDDGHLAGIFPHSPAAKELHKLVSGYRQPPFQRLTLTFPALRQVTAAYVFAFGANKHKALASLQQQTLPLEEQPAQVLKQLSEAYVYSDQIGD